MRERERERERERVTNYLELPNNPATNSRHFLHDNPQKNFRFPAPCIHFYYIRKDAACSAVSLIRSLIKYYNRAQRYRKSLDSAKDGKEKYYFWCLFCMQKDKILNIEYCRLRDLSLTLQNQICMI